MSAKHFRVVKASKNDLSVLNEISIESKMHWNYPQEWMEKWKDDLIITKEEFEGQEIFKMENSGDIIGFCSIMEKKDAYEVMHLWIKPSFIGQGIGRRLLTETMAEVVTTRKEILVISDPNAEQFYKRMGFETFDKIGSYPVGRFLPIMKKKVN